MTVTHTLALPDVDLVYDVHGPNPPADGGRLLFMIGQPMCADGFADRLGRERRARKEATERERRQRHDQRPDPVEVTDELEHLACRAVQRRADRARGTVLPETAEGRAEHEPAAAGHRQPAAEGAAHPVPGGE